MLKRSHTFKYQHDSSMQSCAPYEISVTLSGDSTIDEILERFEGYLRAVGYELPANSHLDFVSKHKNENADS